MIKIKISYTNDNDLDRVIEALKEFKVCKKSKPVEKKDRKNLYLNIE